MANDKTDEQRQDNDVRAAATADGDGKIKLHALNCQISRIGLFYCGKTKTQTVRIELRKHGGGDVVVDLPLERLEKFLSVLRKDVGTIIETGFYVDILRRRYLIGLFDEEDRLRVLTSIMDTGIRIVV